MSTPETASPAVRVAKSPRDVSLTNAKICGVILMLLGVANAVAGVIIGNRITQPSLDEFGDPVTEISPTGWAFIGNAVAVGVILLLAGGVVVAFANALRAPLDGEPVAPAKPSGRPVNL